MRLLITLAVAALLLAGCQTPPPMPAPLLPAAPAEGQPGIWCVLVSTLTTTVRTVYVQLGSDPPAMLVGADCSVRVQAAR